MESFRIKKYKEFKKSLASVEPLEDIDPDTYRKKSGIKKRSEIEDLEDVVYITDDLKQKHPAIFTEKVYELCDDLDKKIVPNCTKWRKDANINKRRIIIGSIIFQVFLSVLALLTTGSSAITLPDAVTSTGLIEASSIAGIIISLFIAISLIIKEAIRLQKRIDKWTTIYNNFKNLRTEILAFLNEITKEKIDKTSDEIRKKALELRQEYRDAVEEADEVLDYQAD